MKIKIMLMFVVVAMFVTGCSLLAKDISEVKTEDSIDKKVTVSGTVENVLKLGELSGYTLKDDTGSIYIATSDLKKEGDRVTTSGVVKKTLLGYYIEE